MPGGVSAEVCARYRLVGKVGEGTYGVVYKAKRLSPSPFMGEVELPGDYAIKMIKPSNDEVNRPSVTSVSTLREISLLRELSHPHVVNMTDVVIDPVERDVAIVMEFADWTLESVLKNHRARQDRISEYSCKAIMYQCLKGLEYCHENWVLHRDLKPQNILIVGDGPKRGQLQLADLGLARIFRAPMKALGLVDKTVVTLWYRAPELLLGTCHYTTAVDVWSLGCICAELFFCHNPRAPPALFAGMQEAKAPVVLEDDQCRQVFSVLGLPDPQKWKDVASLPHYATLTKMRDKAPSLFPPSSILAQRVNDYSKNLQPKGATGLLELMLDLNPQTRISAKQALQHPYLEQFTRNLAELPESVRGNALDDPHDINGRKRNYDSVVPKPLDEHELAAQAKAQAKRRQQAQHMMARQNSAGSLTLKRARP
jgi:cyclin-dependent kinase 8/11